ncbi:hypothetical protein [Streptomyces sp. NPDC007883]|uniref:hypothetical protein n=1 Tax=Streptomyces sp. NPDC007883 TaxID=3155116 RepID=UPI0033F2A4EF
MDALERSILWLGVEDYTGLWEAVLEVGVDAEPSSYGEARVRAGRAIRSLLTDGFIELFVCQEPMNNDSAEIVLPENYSSTLREAEFWQTPEEGGKSVRFAATEKGFAAYKKESGWT